MVALRSSRSVPLGVAAVVCASAGFVLPATSASAATSNHGSVSASVAAKQPATVALRRAKVTVSGSRPASVKRNRWTIPVSRAAAFDASSVNLGGRLKFARGKRSVTFTSLRLSLGKKPTLSGTVGKRRTTILALSGTVQRDATAGTISLKGSRATLNAAAVKVLRKQLSTSRIKSGRLGTTTVDVRVPAAPVAPAPATPSPYPKPVEGPPAPPAPTPPAPPAPEAVCWVPTPSAKTDWIACGTQTGGNLRTWTNYIKGGGTVTLTGDAEVTPSGTGMDHRFSASPTVHPDGRVTVSHTGGIRYFKSYGPAGNLDVLIENVRVEVSADRTSADVVLDATYNSMANPGLPPTSATDVTAMTVNLAGTRATSIPAPGMTTFEIAPATLTAAGRPIWSNYYSEGVAFGAFTITVPNPAG